MSSYLNNTFVYRAPSGVPGDVADNNQSLVETLWLDPANPPLAFGAPVKIVSNLVNAIEASDTAADFYGVLTRSIPGVSGSSSNSGAAVPNTTYAQGILVDGYVFVYCTIGTPSINGTVYMRVVAATGKAIGDLEATADGSNNVALTNVIWAAAGKDSNNVAVIRVSK